MMCVGERLGRSVALIVVIGAKLEWLQAAINWTLVVMVRVDLDWRY